MDKTTSDVAPQTSNVKEEMGLKWIKQPATLPRKHPTLVSALLFVMCNKEFSRHIALIRHQHVHSAENPYVCDVCSVKRTGL